MSSSANLKTYCKAFKVKQPKKPYFCMSFSLQKSRRKVVEYLHGHIDKGSGSINVKLPLDNSDCRLFFENDRYYFFSEKQGRYDLNDLSTDFLGEQLYYPIAEAASEFLKRPSRYEEVFDEMKDLQEVWMHVIIANKEKRITLDKGVFLQFSGCVPGETGPGTINAVYEKDGDYHVCVEGDDDIDWCDLNIDTRVALCDELYGEFLPQVTPRTIEEALTLMALDCKSKLDKITLAHNANTPASILSLLSEDKDEQVRSAVAINKNASAEILSKLAGDLSRNVRQVVADNPNTPAQCLAQLALAKEIVIDFGRERDMCEIIRSSVARNPNSPEDVLVKLAEDPSEYVRKAASEHLAALTSYPSDKTEDKTESKAMPGTVEPENSFSAEQLAKMALDSDYKVRRLVAKNPNTPSDCLAMLVDDPWWDVVEGCLLNPNMPLKTLLGVANLDQKYMKVVVDNPGLPLQSLLEFAAISCYYPKEFPTGRIIIALLNRI